MAAMILHGTGFKLLTLSLGIHSLVIERVLYLGWA